MAKKAKTSIVIGAADLELEKGVVYVQSASFSGPRTAKLFGDYVTVRIVVSPDLTIPQLWLSLAHDPYGGDSQCSLVRSQYAPYELLASGLTLVGDMDGNPVEFELTDAAEQAIATWYAAGGDSNEPQAQSDDPLPFVPDTPPVDESSEEAGVEPEAADETDPGEEEDFGYTDEAEESEETSEDDDGAIELPDFSAMTRKELVEYATEFELAFNSRTSDEKLREIVKAACLLAMGAGVEE